MTDTATRGIRFIGLTLVVLLASTSLLAPPSSAAEMDLTATKRAVSALGQFQRNLQSMRSVVNAKLGPYPISTKCTWCSKKIIVCVTETTRTYSWDVDFNWTRSALSRVLGAAAAHASTFSTSFAPTQAWLEGLPAFSAGFASAADLVLAVQAEIKAGNGPTDQQRQRVTQALGTLVNDLKNSSQLLSNGTSALTTFLQQQSSYRDSIKTAIGGAAQSAQTALANYENETKTWRCRGGLKEKFTTIKAEFSASTQRIAQTFQTLNESSRETEKALATMVGSLVSSQSDYQSILKQVEAAQKDELGSFLEKLHLNTAKNQWKQLADYATQNL